MNRVALALLMACGAAQGEPLGSKLGGASSVVPSGARSFNKPAPNILAVPVGGDTFPHDLLFQSGNAVFTDAWVEAGASTRTRDGLGPLFNARSCESCHVQDGKGSAPQTGELVAKGLLLRLSVRDTHTQKPTPHPIYGDQLQNMALGRVVPEAKVWVTWVSTSRVLPDGTKVSLRAPQFELKDLGYGPLEEPMISPRLAPHLTGVGLLDTIPRQTIEGFQDPNDLDADGIRGHVHYVRSDETGELTLGRFGWKAEKPSVLEQNAGAFLGDMGITSRLHRAQNCPATSDACLAAPTGGEPEATVQQLDRLTLYTKLTGVPLRRDADDPDVMAGEHQFFALGCAGCHRVGIHTGVDPAFPELSNQLIHPFTDLLLHDMGEALSDHRDLSEAKGQEWRTAPLWGLGLVQIVNPESGFLHDGRARSILEAILWHGGEASKSMASFSALSSAERAQVLKFLGSL